MTADEIKHDLEVICPKITKTTGCNDGTICADCIADCLKTMGYCKQETLLKEFVEYVIKQHTTESGQKLIIFHQVLLDNLENFIKERDSK